jgi:hypothetical protein
MSLVRRGSNDNYELDRTSNQDLLGRLRPGGVLPWKL